MSGAISAEQGSFPGTCNHQELPKYQPVEPKQDIYIFALENEWSRRNLAKKLNTVIAALGRAGEEWRNAEGDTDIDHRFFADHFQLISKQAEEMQLLFAGLAYIYQERTDEMSGLYLAFSRLTDNEFDQVYASSSRDTRPRTPHNLAPILRNIDLYEVDILEFKDDRSLEDIQSHEAKGSSCDTLLSREELLTLSANMNQMGEQHEQDLQSNNKVDSSKLIDDSLKNPNLGGLRRTLKRLGLR